MRYCDILLHLTADGRSAAKTITAFAIAKRFGSKVTAVYTLPFPSRIYYMGEYMPPHVIQEELDEARGAAQAERRSFEAAAREAGIMAEWIHSEETPSAALQLHGRSCDLAVVSQSNPDRSNDRASGVDALPGDLALALGRPVLVVPYIGDYAAPGHHIVVAWSNSREAARAVHDAMPLLLAAGSVTVLGIDADPQQQHSAAALMQHLSHYGIVARVKHTTAADLGVGEVLLSTLADENADLLVMGAYGHSRLREMALGGATYTILDSMTVPVLLGN